MPDGLSGAFLMRRASYTGSSRRLCLLAHPARQTCHGQSVSALAKQYGGLNNAAAALGYPSVSALQDAILAYVRAKGLQKIPASPSPDARATRWSAAERATFFYESRYRLYNRRQAGEPACRRLCQYD